MINIITPSQFKTIPWKNGLGETTELAIDEGGSVNHFGWRLSIASVVSDGLFSDFSGYHRQLVLIEGNGVKLTHNGNEIDQLDKLLSIASFDGGCQTVGSLVSGPIKDFNIMTNKKKYSAIVETYPGSHSVTLVNQSLCFAYGLSSNIEVILENQQTLTLPKGHLLNFEESKEQATNRITLVGRNILIIKIKKNTF